ncbi:MAG: glucose 1-dehydrogenase [Armatimonadetes bacterium]|nr:glucose 1-dehydrogenase [Armatimonadota bacterium]
MSNEARLEGKRALVTGSGTGLGYGIALEFARQGADVVLHYSHSAAGAEDAVEQIKAMGRKSVAFKADFTDVDQVQELGRQAIGFLGGIDCLVNNAGVTFNKRFLKVTREQYDMTYNVNIRAQFFLTQVIVEDMLKHGGGSIVNLTSVHGVSGAPEHSVYAGTKGAIIAYTRTLAVELAHMGVRVNAIAPGMVVVPNYFKPTAFTPEAIAQVAHDKIPIGRHGEPVEIGRLAAFLCSDESGFIIGQTIVADGGTTSLMSLIDDFRNEATSSLGGGYVPGI